MFACGVGCAFFYNAFLDGVFSESFFGALFEDVKDLKRVVWGKKNFFFVEGALDSWVDVIHKEKVIRDADEGDFCVFEF